MEMNRYTTVEELNRRFGSDNVRLVDKAEMNLVDHLASREPSCVAALSRLDTSLANKDMRVEANFKYRSLEESVFSLFFRPLTIQLNRDRLKYGFSVVAFVRVLVDASNDEDWLREWKQIHDSNLKMDPSLKYKEIFLVPKRVDLSRYNVYTVIDPRTELRHLFALPTETAGGGGSRFRGGFDLSSASPRHQKQPTAFTVVPSTNENFWPDHETGKLRSRMSSLMFTYFSIVQLEIFYFRAMKNNSEPKLVLKTDPKRVSNPVHSAVAMTNSASTQDNAGAAFSASAGGMGFAPDAMRAMQDLDMSGRVASYQGTEELLQQVQKEYAEKMVAYERRSSLNNYVPSISMGALGLGKEATQLRHMLSAPFFNLPEGLDLAHNLPQSSAPPDLLDRRLEFRQLVSGVLEVPFSAISVTASSSSARNVPAVEAETSYFSMSLTATTIELQDLMGHLFALCMNKHGNVSIPIHTPSSVDMVMQLANMGLYRPDDLIKELQRITGLRTLTADPSLGERWEAPIPPEKREEGTSRGKGKGWGASAKKETKETPPPRMEETHALKPRHISKLKREQRGGGGGGKDEEEEEGRRKKRTKTKT